MKKNNFIPIILMFLSGCAHQFSTKKETTHITHELQTKYALDTHWDNYYTYKNDPIPPSLSEQDAIALGLERSSSLQADFAQLGIAKADVVQAGFFTNPNLELIFQRPHRRTATNNATAIEVDLLFNVSDLWIVPRRKKLAESNLEVRSREVLQRIIEKISEIKRAHVEWTYTLRAVEVEQSIFALIEQIEQKMLHRAQFGLHTQLDLSLIAIEKQKALNTILEKKGSVQGNVYQMSKHLKIAHEHIHSIRAISSSLPHMPHLSTQQLTHMALTHNPLIHIAQARIQRAQRALSLEKAQRFNNIQAGISYNKETNGSSEKGPNFSLDIPIFDTNSAAIERARHTKDEAEKLLTQEMRNATTMLHNAYSNYETTHAQLTLLSQTMIPEAQRAIEFAREQAQQMQFSILVILEAMRTLFELQRQEVMLEKMLHYARIDIEATLGMNVEKLNVAYNSNF